jgi:exopolyphosphatase/guanosine-5'-triphosphate,3'-diphosphate pyrophosphatase
MQGRRGPPWFQNYYLLSKLFQKENVFSDNSSFISRVAPYINLIFMLAASLCVPLVYIPVSDFGIGNAYIFATASLRNIANTEEAVKRIEDEMGLYVDVLSGEEEARLGFMGATLAVNIEKGLFIDIGGGSTELVTFRKREILKATSMPVGSLNLFLRHTAALLPTDGSMKKIKQDVLSEMGKTDLFQKGKQNVICGIGGTVRAARKLYNELYSLPCDNATMETENLSRMLAFYKENGRDFSRKILEIAPDRIHTIIPGMIILNTIAKKSRSENIIVSQCGVREGYLFDKVLRI